MKIETRDVHLDTQGFSDIHDLTSLINRIVKESGVGEGFCHIFAVGSTASVSTMEFEPALVQDVKEKNYFYNLTVIH